MFSFSNRYILSVRIIRCESIRWYRFGNRVRPKTGFYLSPTKEANDEFLEKTVNVNAKHDWDAMRKKRNEIFDTERRRQSSLVPRIEKIEVKVIDIPQSISETQTVTLLMNKNISTPFNCAQHIHEFLMKRSVLAHVNDSLFIDMNRPLTDDCTIKFRHFKETETLEVNKAFWRSCSFIMGMTIEKAFKDDVTVYLHSWPKPDPKSGSFVYDVAININNWVPTQSEIRVFTAMMRKVIKDKLNFERLDVNVGIAKQIFEYNIIKSEQIDSIASKSHDKETVTLYRVGDHIDMSHGPMIPNTSLIGITYASAIIPIKLPNGLLYRFQGIALPEQLDINAFTFDILKNRAKKLNMSGLSQLYLNRDFNGNPQDTHKISNDKIKESVDSNGLKQKLVIH